MTLLIYPPVAKPCEPSAGLARLAGALKMHGQACQVWDANLESLMWLTEQPAEASDRWTRQAMQRRPIDLKLLQSPGDYHSFSRYSTAIRNLNRLLAVNGTATGSRISLADFQQQAYSPIRSEDLLAVAEAPERNPFFPFLRSQLCDRLTRHNSGRIGISLIYLSQALPTFALIGIIRREYPDLKIIVGGGLITSWMRRPDWKNPFAGWIDTLVDGPGEIPLLDLSGIHTQSDDPYLPDFSDIPWASYISPGPIVPYNASRGCYWNHCAFCPEPGEGHAYKPVGTPQILAELKQLIAVHNPAMIHFTDNAMSPALLRALIESPPGVPWYGFVRITPQLTDADFCVGLRRAGCRLLKIGLESGDEAVLEGMQKGLTLDLASRALKTMAAAGLAAYVYLLFGTPWEDEARAQNTLDFVVKHKNAITFINPAIFNLPVDAITESGLTTRAFYKADLQLYTDFIHPQAWNRSRVRRFLDRTFKRQPDVADILRRTPPSFTSNHAAFFADKYLLGNHHSLRS